MSIAILVLAHKNEEQVNRLVDHLVKDFSIYVHIDKNSKIKIKEQENVYVYKKYKTYWGSYNIVRATLLLLKKAYENAYNRYLLISGQDLPIKTNEEIKKFFTENKCEYIFGEKMPVPGVTSNGGLEWVTKYWPNWNLRENKNMLKEKIYRFERKVLNIISKIKIRPLDYEFYKGMQWVNFTHDCVKKILNYLENDKKYLKRYKWTNCSDEIFFQTLLNQLKDLHIVNNSLRFVDWESGPEFPRVLRENDYDRIINSGAIFARKFDADIDERIISKIFEKIG